VTFLVAFIQFLILGLKRSKSFFLLSRNLLLFLNNCKSDIDVISAASGFWELRDDALCYLSDYSLPDGSSFDPFEV
jgi:hypothetical protein